MPHRPLHQRLTVVLLTYNCESRIGSVVARLRTPQVPIVAVDNASADGTADVIAAAGVRVIRLPRNIGAAARNAGVEAVRTPYVAFCDDGEWCEPEGLPVACDLLDRFPRLALMNARIMVGDDRQLDPISTEMADSPLLETTGIPGAVLMGFMAGASIMRVSAYRQVGGYDPRLFLGGEEETLSYTPLKHGWELRYPSGLVVAHHPNLANFAGLRAHGMRNTLWTACLHRRFLNAVRYTDCVLAGAPKNRAYLRAVAMALWGLPWVLRGRRPMSPELDRNLRLLDARRYAARCPASEAAAAGTMRGQLPNHSTGQPTRPRPKARTLCSKHSCAALLPAPRERPHSTP